MPMSRRVSVAAALAVSLLVLVAVASAEPTPGTVTVRVMGAAPNYEALTPLTQIPTTTTTLTRFGGSCPGTSAAQALDLATAGKWEGTWNQKYEDFEVTSIDGLSYSFSGPNYWALWLNYKEAESGVCHALLNGGDQVLFLPSCYGSACPPAPNVLDLQVEPTAETKSAVAVTVIAHTPTGQEQPASDVTVSGGGASAETDTAGHAVLVFASHGSYTLHAVHSGAVPGEALICVHEGNDGTCGTTAPTTPPSTTSGTTASEQPKTTTITQQPTKPVPPVADITQPLDNHFYSTRHAPRVLAGEVTDATRVTSLAIRLRRTWRGRCWAYDGAKEAFRRVRCRRGGFFDVTTGTSFSYLLPSKLEPGRYVLDVKATDSAGERTTLARGTSRIVFYVR